MATPTQVNLGPKATWIYGVPGDGGVTVGVNQAEAGIAAACWDFAKSSACP